MRDETYERLLAYSGYVGTKGLLKGGLTNRQIAHLTEEGLLERVCRGYYWVKREGVEKPKEYKAVEACLSDSRAVICADSACFYLGLIPTEPNTLSIATARNDRCAIQMNFPIKRHYFSQKNFDFGCNRVSVDFGGYNVFDVEKSVCDCIRFRKDIDGDIFELVIENYRGLERQQWERMQEYAKRMRMLKEVKRFFGDEV